VNFTNRILLKGIVLALVAGLLLSCGGKEERKAKYLERGKAYLAEKNFDKARIEFKNVLQIDPKDAQGYLYLGQVEEKDQSWAKAFGNYKKASELDPELIEPRVRLAKFYLAQARALKARDGTDAAANALGLMQEQIQEIRARDPENAEALTLEATLWVNDGETDRALAQLEKVNARDPGLQSAAVLLASIYAEQGRAADAEAVLLKAVDLNPEPMPLQQRLVAQYAKNKQNDKAEAVLRQMIRDNPDELSVRVSLASFLSQTEQLNKAEQVLNEAIAANPDDAQRYLLLVQFLTSRQGEEAAMEKLQQFIAQRPDMTELQMQLVRMYLSAGQKDKAEQTLQTIIDKQGTQPAGLQARVALAQVIASENMDDERVAALIGQVLGENPRDNQALLLKGKLAAHHKDYVEAINNFRSVLKDQPENADVLQLLAAAHLANNERELALDTLKRGVESNPDSSKLRLSLAQFLVQDGDIDAGIKQLDEILAVDKDNEQALKAKFELLARKGDVDGMQAVARRMQEIAPESEVGFIQEAQLRFGQKDYAAAIEILDQLLAKNPEKDPEPSLYLVGSEHFSLQETAMTDKVGNKAVDGFMVEVKGGIKLQQLAVVHNPGAITHDKGFVLIVGNEDGGHVLFLQQVAHIHRQSFTQFGVEVGEGLIQQQQAGFRSQCPRNRNTLLLTTRQLVRVAVTIPLHTNKFQHAVSDAYLFSSTACRQPKGDIAGNI